MSLLEPIGLAFLATLPVITLLYFLKLRRQRRTVSSTLLWARAVTEARANTPFQRLRTSLLLLLQLLLAALLALALARPYVAGVGRLASRRILVLDGSASMTARGADGRTRFEEARRAARDLLDGGEGSETMVVLAGPRPRVLQSFTADRRRLEAALVTAGPSEAPADLARALSMALAITARDAGRDIVLVTDGAAPPLPPSVGSAEGVRLLTVGGSVPNLGITSFDAALTSSGGADWELFVGVTNFGEAERTGRVAVTKDGGVVDARSVVVPPGQTRGVVVPVQAQEGQVVTAELQPGDGLACDDRAVGVLPKGGARRVAVVSPTGQIDPWLQRAFDPHPRLRLEARRAGEQVGPEEYDLIVFDGVTPSRVEPGAYLFLGASGEVRVAGDAAAPLLFSTGTPAPYPAILEWDRSSPLLRYVTLADVHLREGVPLLPGDGVRVLVEMEAGALMVGDLRGAVRFLALGFDYRASDLPYRAAFPILLGNALAALPWGASERQPLTRAAGEVQDIGAADGAVIVTGPGGVRHALAPGALRFDETTKVGLYRVSVGERAAGAFAVSLLSPEESNLAARLTVKGEGAAAKPANALRSVKRELYPWLLALALAVLLLEWGVYHRRSYA